MLAQDLHNYLTNFSHDLTIPDEIIRKGDAYMQKIFLLLQSQSRYKLDRCRLLGGVSKKTSIVLKFDYDCVVYVNDIDPPFDQLLDEWDTILTLKLKDMVSDTKLTKHSIQFGIDGFDFDLLPSSNYTGVNHDVMKQVKTIWKKIEDVPDVEKQRRLSSLYSSGLSELALEFMKKQSGFIHDLCRLAKFWKGTILFEQYVSGRSSIIEYLAVKAGQEEEAAAINDKLSILRGFRRFLNLLNNYERIDIIFTTFYDRDLVPISKKPYLIDPTNPYNNLLGSVPAGFLPMFSKCSKETLKRLDACENNITIELEKLFDPQPDLYDLFPSQMNKKHIVTLLSFNQNCDEKSPKLIVRRNTFDSKMLEALKNIMPHVLKYIASAVEFKSTGDIGKCVQQAAGMFLSRSLYRDNQTWLSTDKKHDECDITFILPLNIAKKYALYISMNK